MEKITDSSLEEVKGSAFFDPWMNSKAIAMVQDKDGNWRGWMQRFGNVVEIRDIGPETVLQRLLTSDGGNPAERVQK